MRGNCFFPGCEATVEPPQECCYGHWELIPLPLRRTIVRLRGVSGYDEALANGIHQVAEMVHAGRPLPTPGRFRKPRV